MHGRRSYAEKEKGKSVHISFGSSYSAVRRIREKRNLRGPGGAQPARLGNGEGGLREGEKSQKLVCRIGETEREWARASRRNGQELPLAHHDVHRSRERRIRLPPPKHQSLLIEGREGGRDPPCSRLAAARNQLDREGYHRRPPIR